MRKVMYGTEMRKVMYRTEGTGCLELQPWEPGHGLHVGKLGSEKVGILGSSLLLKDQACLGRVFLGLRSADLGR